MRRLLAVLIAVVGAASACSREPDVDANTKVNVKADGVAVAAAVAEDAGARHRDAAAD